MKGILNCKIFDGYVNKEYEINIKHRLFGKNKMNCAINGFVDDENRIGIIVHGRELYCYKQDEHFSFVEKNDRVIMSDELMKIVIKI